jgi:3-oxoacyl-[acyl-carrier-protein] synthase-3
MAPVGLKAIEEAGLTPEDLSAFIPHQANERIIDSLAKSMKLPESIAIARDIKTTGNTSAASIPLAMDTLLKDSPELHGKLALLIGFGAGLVYSSQVVVLP